MYKLSYHAQVERQERLFAIVDTIGLGREVDRFYVAEKHQYEVFTDTGVLIILNEENYVVTAFAVLSDKATAVYRHNGRSHISPRVMNGIRYHEEHYKFLNKL